MYNESVWLLVSIFKFLCSMIFAVYNLVSKFAAFSLNTRHVISTGTEKDQERGEQRSPPCSPMYNFHRGPYGSAESGAPPGVARYAEKAQPSDPPRTSEDNK